MELGLFQLENLFANPNRFLFLDLRTHHETLPLDLARLFEKAVAVAAGEVSAYLQKQNIAKEMPLILVCEEGRLSEKTAQALEASGYQQVYVVAGGVKGLLSEL